MRKIILTILLSTLQISMANAAEKLMLVVDGSNSMWGQLEGVSKIDIARDALGELIDQLADDSEAGLIAYGHRTAGDCSDVQTMVAPAALDRTALKTAIGSIQPTGKTPISQALSSAIRTLGDNGHIVLISDGVETCDDDPCGTVQSVRAQRDIVIDVIGFDLDAEAVTALSCLTDGGGRMLAAADAGELSEALNQAAAQPLPAGLVSQLQGEAVAIREQISSPLSLQAPVFVADTLQTAEQSSLEVSLRDGSRFSLAENSRVALAEYVTEAQPKTLLELAKGRLRSSVNNTFTNNNDGWQVQTDQAVMGVQGTVFDVSADSDSTEVFVYQGKVEVSSRDPGYPDSVLLEAGQTVTVAAGQPVPTPQTFGLDVSVTLNGADVAAEILVLADDGQELARGTAPAEFALLEGDYQVTATLLDEQSETEASGESQTVDVTVEQPDSEVEIIFTRATVSMEAPQTVAAGSVFSVAWEAQGVDQQDFITLVKADAEPGTLGTYQRIKQGASLQLQAPDAAGDYELRFATNADRSTLASQSITVTGVEAELIAPATVGAGSVIEVSWEGPDNNNDYVTIVAPDTDDGKFGEYTRTRDGNPLELQVPDAPGDYELRYMTGQSAAVLARQTVVVAAVEATVTAPETIGAGAEFEVNWSGPDNTNDYVTIVDATAADGNYGNYTRTRDGNPLNLRAPDAAGDYEIRYQTGQSAAVLARQPISVTATDVTLETSASIGAGADFKVSWTGPDNTNDYITIVEATADDGKYAAYTRTRDGNPLKLRAPEQAGEYEVRYMTGQSGAVLQRQAVTVEAVSASLTVDGAAMIGGDITVNWEGPDNQRDMITIVAAGAAEGKYDKFTYTSNGSPVVFSAPDAPGDYEVRYMLAKSRTTLASTIVSVTPTRAMLTVPDSVQTGARFAVEWVGPDAQDDYLIVLAADAESEAGASKALTRAGNPANLYAPIEAGDYVVKYMTDSGKRELASEAVTVVDE